MASEDSIVNFGSLDAWMRGFALATGAVKRRWASIALFVLLFVAVGAAAAVFLPRSYSTKASLLVKKNYVMPALANPKRSVPTGAESPTQSAAEFVLSRQSLENIVNTNDLLARWDRDRPAVLRLKDRAVELVKGPIPQEDKMDALVDVLAKRISVSVDNEVVTVKAFWSDRVTARDLVNGSVAAFLDTRRKLEVQTIADTYGILKRTADLERARIDSQLATVVDVQRASQRTRAARSVPRPAAAAVAETPVNDGLGDLRAAVLAAREARDAAEKRHANKVADVEASLAERRATRTERHPDVVALRLALERVRVEPAELAAARAEETRLLADYSARGGNPSRVAEAGPAAAPAAQAAPPARAEADFLPASSKEEEDDATVYARSLFKGSLATYQDVIERLRNVEIELATAEASFSYRYTITSPARLPKKADSPNVPLILVGAFVTGLMAGVVRALFRELSARSLLSPAALLAHLSAPLAEPAAS